jgi:hypothetical protein
MSVGIDGVVERGNGFDAIAGATFEGVADRSIA